MSIPHSSLSFVFTFLFLFSFYAFFVNAQTRVVNGKESERELVRQKSGSIRSLLPNRDQSESDPFGPFGTVCDSHPGSSIVVAANATTAGYSTLKASFDAINAGIRTGSIELSVCGNTTETASAILTASGTGSSNYTDITIRPVGGPRIVEGSIGLGGVIKLEGADHITIDGRLGGDETSRGLTVRNNFNNNNIAAIWISGVSAGNGATNNIIRNLEISCGTDSSVSGNVSFGIYMGGGSVSVATNGVDNDNNSFIANRIVKARYGIVTRGTMGNLSENTVISRNVIGPESFGSEQIGKVGIFAQFDADAQVSDNVVQNVGCLFPQACTVADRFGIAIGGDESWNSTGGVNQTSARYTVVRNIIRGIIEEKRGSAVGLRLGTTASGGIQTNNLVANNFIYGVRSNGASAKQAVGIGISGGHSDSVVFNSVALSGDLDSGTALSADSYASAIRVNSASGTAHSNLTLKNNSIYLDVSSNNSALRIYAITLTSSAYSFGSGGLDHNNYFINPSNLQLRTGGFATLTGLTAAVEFSSLADWRAAFTSQQDTNSIQADPLYLDVAGNLHISAGSPNVNAGTAMAGVVADIDGQTRGKTPDIGADEFAAPTAASVSVGGRVTTAGGAGILNASVRIEGGGLAEPRLARTNGFGYYSLDGLAAGQTYVITVSAKRHAFAQPTRLITLYDSVQDADFVAEP